MSCTTSLLLKTTSFLWPSEGSSGSLGSCGSSSGVSGGGQLQGSGSAAVSHLLLAATAAALRAAPNTADALSGGLGGLQHTAAALPGGGQSQERLAVVGGLEV